MGLAVRASARVPGCCWLLATQAWLPASGAAGLAMPSLLKASLGVPLVLVLLVQAVHLVCRKEYRALTKGGVVVTGASTGIGHHAAVSLAKAGFVVFAGVRKQKDADTIAAQKVPGLHPIILDVTKQDTIDVSVSMVKADLAARSLNLVALVNNAGIAKTFPVELLDMDDVVANFEVNYFGVVRVTQAFLPLLRETGDGARLVQVSSVAGFISSAGGNPYAATKFALEALTDALRLELAPWRISVSTINPAFVATPILGRPGDKGADAQAAQLGRLSAQQKELYHLRHIVIRAGTLDWLRFT
jgi:NAD(P)-dependent dehydrogenase (short-subunit alcohol dehydrogenase family)